MSDTLKAIVVTAGVASIIVIDQVRYETVKNFIQPLTTLALTKRTVPTWVRAFVGVAGITYLLSILLCLKNRKTMETTAIIPRSINIEKSDMLNDNFMRTTNEHKYYICYGDSHNCEYLLRE